MQCVRKADAWHDFIDLEIKVNQWARTTSTGETLLGPVRHHVRLTVGALSRLRRLERQMEQRGISRLLEMLLSTGMLHD